MILLIDNYDSFTFNVKHYFLELHQKVKVVRNDKITVDKINKLKPKAIVLSPGPCTPNEAGICLNTIEQLYSKFPILGICLGHQTIGQAFGSKIIKCNEIMHGKVDTIYHFGNSIFKNVDKEFKATRYHSLIIEKKSLSKDFIITAETKNKIIMGIAHKKLPIYGLQFHPESIGTDMGKSILKNFLTIIK
tara:strand:- start:1702 stop:2271 length:570 start_codon:yes stop_codon:yes gene_type:complete